MTYLLLEVAKKHISKFSSNSKVDASKLLENEEVQIFNHKLVCDQSRNGLYTKETGVTMLIRSSSCFLVTRQIYLADPNLQPHDSVCFITKGFKYL